MANSSIYAAFERMWEYILIKIQNHKHGTDSITGILEVERGGTGYDSIVDNEYTLARYRASTLDSVESVPVDNGIINWVYE